MTKNKKIIILGSTVVAVAIVVAVYYKPSHTIVSSNGHPSSKLKQNKNPLNKTQNNSTTKPTTSTTTPNTINPEAPSNSGSNNQTLLAPFGSFVSNHNPSLSDSSENYELSTCETTQGASCYIEFTNSSGQNIILPSQTANSQGVVSWGWSLTSKGFTVGSWSITAVASLNGQTKTSTGTNLIVQQ